jgi:hypothetical protein
MNTKNEESQAQARARDQRYLRSRLRRLQAFASPGSGFSGARSALVACIEEMEDLQPRLAEFFSAEPSRSLPSPQRDGTKAIEQIQAENRSRLRELHALFESGKRLLEDRPTSREADPVAEALNAYLVALVCDLLRTLEGETSEASTNGTR